MMLECKSNAIKTYKDGDFRIEITDDGNTHGAWLSHENYGIKRFMFGVQTDKPLAEFIDIVERNLPLYERNFIKYVTEG